MSSILPEPTNRDDSAQARHESLVCGFCKQPIDTEREEWGTLAVPGVHGSPDVPFMDVHRSCFEGADDEEGEAS